KSISVDVAALSAALKRVRQVIGSNSTLPVLGSVRLRGGDGWLELMATDLDRYYSARGLVDGDASGLGLCVPANMLAGLLAAAGKTAVGLVLEFSGSSLRVVATGGRVAKVIGYDVEEMPEWPAAFDDDEEVVWHRLPAGFTESVLP